MASNTQGCGCSGVTPCHPTTCTSYVKPECETLTLNTSNTEHPQGLSDVTDVSLNVKQISAYKEHLEFVNSPVGLSNIVGHTVIKLSQKFLDFVNNIFRPRNLGSGVKVYKDTTTEEGVTYQNFRTIEDSESIKFIETPNEIIGEVSVEWIRNLFISGEIDICELVQSCGSAPVMVGDIAYNLNNRTSNFPISTQDFTSRYYDADNDEFTSIRITGGNLVGLTKTVGGVTTPLAINDIIPVSDIGSIKYSSPNQDSPYTQTVTYVAIASNGEESN